MNLKGDWRKLYSKSATPLGLYARKNWLGENTPAFRRLMGKTIDRLRSGQRGDGSWGGSVAETIEHLFQLHLTARKPDRAIGKALDWLMEKDYPPMTYRCSGDGAPYSNLLFRMARGDREKLSNLKGTPFTRGCSGFVKTGAALMFAKFFDRLDDEWVASAFRSLDAVNRVRGGRWCSPSCGMNILRGYAVHPAKSTGAAMKRALARYAKEQTKRGDWGNSLFLHTFHAFSQVNLPAARRQVKKALPALLRRQNADGSWGRSQREWDTFMAVHSLKVLGLV